MSPTLAQDRVKEATQAEENFQAEIDASRAAEAEAEARARAAAAEAAEHRAQRLGAERRQIGRERALLGQSIVAREEALDQAARHLDALRREIAATRARLGASRAELQTLMGRMQRAAREPLPALVAHPDRPVQAARSALLMRSLTKRLRLAREAMTADLTRLDESARRVSVVERSAAAELSALRQEEGRANQLLERKRAAEATEREAAAEARREAEELGKHAQSLAALAAALQKQRALTAVAAPKPRLRPSRPSAAEQGAGGAEATEEIRTASLPPPGRAISPRPSLSFEPAGARAPGARLLKPASGEMAAADGAKRHGVYVFTRPYARVISPASGLVRYAADITSEGKVVVIETQSGALILLAGLCSVETTPGGHVSAGEPIGRMGGPPSTSEEFMFEYSAETAAVRERLYIEIHKGGRQIDPRPWFGREIKEVAVNE